MKKMNYEKQNFIGERAQYYSTDSNYNSCDAIVKSCYRYLLENNFGLKSHYGRGKTVAEIAHRYPHNNVIMRVYAHLTSSVCGNVYDLFDCTEEIVDEYWVVR